MQGKKTSRESKEPMKVKYISSPVLVNAKNAAEFKAIVQELTGKDSSDEHHHHGSSPAAAGSRAHMSVPNQGPYNYGVTNAKLGHGVEQFQGSSTTESDQHEENVFWNFSESLSGCGFPYG